MKKVYLFLTIMLIFSYSYSQQLSLETGTSVTSMSYTYSTGEEPESISPKTNYYFYMGYKQTLFKTPFSAIGGVSYKNIEATSNQPELGNYYEWDFDYIGANLGILYEILKPYDIPNVWNGFTVGLKAACAMDFPVKAVLNENNVTYNLIDAEPYGTPVFYVIGGVSLNYYVHSRLSFGAYFDLQKSTTVIKALYGHMIPEEQLGFTNKIFGIGITYSFK